MELLRIENLSVGYKTYRGSSKVLDDINIYVREGEKVGLVGPTGSGKTTLLNTILRILPPNGIIYKGKIFFKGIEILTAKKKILNKIRRENIGIIFQDPMSSLNPFFKIHDQLYDALKYSKALNGKNVNEKILRELGIKLLKEVALPDPERVLDSYPFQLSGGMRQRVSIALALTRANDLLLADEPTTNLDVTIQEQILNLLRELVNERKLSIILVTHALGMLREFVDRVYVMYAGQIMETAETDELFSNPIHPYTKFLFESVPKLVGPKLTSEAGGGGLPRETLDYVNPPSGCRFSLRCPFADHRCRVSKPPLYEVSKGHFVACWLSYKG